MSLNNQYISDSRDKSLPIIRFAVGFVVGLLISISYASAYDSENDTLSDGESYCVTWGIDYASYESSVDHPVWYQPIKDYFVKFDALFKEDPPTIDMTVFVQREKWREEIEDYETDEQYGWIGHTWYGKFERKYGKQHEEVLNIDQDPIKEYFKNNTEDIDDFIPIGQSDHPDILNVTIDINGNGTAFDQSVQGYVAMTEDDLKGMKSTIDGQDYGFSLSGMGGEGGIGEIYSSVGTGGKRSGGMSDIFKYLFYALIPILFILSIFNMITKIFQ